MASKINVFLVGAQKAGTTSLYEWLGQHPDICAPQEIKDYHFFTNEDIYIKGVTHLEKFYEGSGAVSLHGAVNYLYFYRKSARRIYEYNPNAKIIICLREPVARAVSAYMYCVKTLREERTFTDALNFELNGGPSTFKQLSDNTYIEHGKYVEQIREFMTRFQRDKIKIVLFEDLMSSSRREASMRDILCFLGLNEVFEFEFTHLNNSGSPRSSMVNYILRKGYLAKVARPFLPRSMRKRIAGVLNEINTSNSKINVDIKDEDIALVRQHLGRVGSDLYNEFGIDVLDSWE